MSAYRGAGNDPVISSSGMIRRGSGIIQPSTRSLLNGCIVHALVDFLCDAESFACNRQEVTEETALLKETT